MRMITEKGYSLRCPLFGGCFARSLVPVVLLGQQLLGAPLFHEMPRGQARALNDGHGRGFIGFINERELMWRPFQISGFPEGIEMKLLSRDRLTGAVSLLARYPAGWRHDIRGFHSGDEEIFVLEGTLRIGPRILTRRAYAYIPAGMVHGPISSETGCLALWFFSTTPDFIPEAKAPQESSEAPTAIFKYFEEEPWVSSVEAGFARAPGIFMKILRMDRQTGAMTWIAGSFSGRPPRQWEAHTTWEEGFCLEGEFLLAECLPDGMRIGALKSGSYFFRPAGIRHVGPYSGTTSYVIWFFRTPARLETTYYDECIAQRRVP
jgi:hypothetical protein